MNCNECNKGNPNFEHETAIALAERTIKRLWILAILLIVCLIGTNVAWIIYESQWEVVETVQEVTQQAEGNGDNSFIGGNYYGSPDSADYYKAQNAENGR